MNIEIINDVLKFLKRFELDKFRKIKNLHVKNISEYNSYNMFRISTKTDLSDSSKWELYKNIDYKWMKNDGNSNVSDLSSLFESIPRSVYEISLNPFFENKNEIDLFSFSDLALFTYKITLYGKMIDDNCLEWIYNFKNLKTIILNQTNVSDECEDKLNKMKIEVIRKKTLLGSACLIILDK